MIVNGTIVLPHQRQAGIEAMRGKFVTGAVTRALRDAGVTTKDGFVAKVAERLVKHQRDLGKVKRLATGGYQGARVH